MTNELLEAPAVAICLYRVVQEALNNVAKHSRASEVHIRLVRGTGEFDLPACEGQRPRHGIRGQAQVRILRHPGHAGTGPGPWRDHAYRQHAREAAPFWTCSFRWPARHGRRSLRVEAGGRQRRRGRRTARLDDGQALPRLLSRATDQTLQDVIDAIAGQRGGRGPRTARFDSSIGRGPVRASQRDPDNRRRSARVRTTWRFAGAVRGTTNRR